MAMTLILPPKFINSSRPLSREKLTWLSATRLARSSESEIKALNRLGNRFFLNTINFIFKVKLSDTLSGYRVFAGNS